MWISSGGHFEIQYGGHKERISSGPISENVRNILIYICAKFGACITKCTTGLLHCYKSYYKNCQDASVNKRLKQLKQRSELFDLFVKRKR